MNTKHRIPLFVTGLTLLAALLVVNTTGASSSVTTITRVSVDSDGTQSDGFSYYPSLSADGRYVAFVSDASNLVSGDTNGDSDVFVHDTQTGVTTRVSVDSNGMQAYDSYPCSWYSDPPSLSADGRYVAFISLANNLVSGDTNGWSDIFVHDMQTGATTRVSVDSSGGQGNDSSDSPSISADGHYVVFSSYANNLVSGDANKTSDIFIHDMQTGTTTLISVDSTGSQGNNSSYDPSISADGRKVVFYSNADNLVSGDTNGTHTDIFVHDLQTGTTTRVSMDSSGVQGNEDSYYPSISADGRYVVFSSYASNLVSGDINERNDVFLHDLQMGTTTLVSMNSSGLQGNNYSYDPSISGDGRYVVFSSYANNLVSGDTNVAAKGIVPDDLETRTFTDTTVAGSGNFMDIFVHDMQTGNTARLSANSNGAQGNGQSEAPAISADGLYVTFFSYADNLVSDDTDSRSDVFITPATVFNLTVNKTGSGSGLVYTDLSSPAGITCGSVCSNDFVSGTTISLSAIPDSSSDIFTGWGGDVTGMDNPAIFIINKNMLITANFVNAWKVYLPLAIR
jgi:Tol biopolymer transport system component